MACSPHSLRPAGLQTCLLRWALAGLALLAGVTLQAQRLPLRSFSPADGLPAGAVRRIVRDTHGFLWFCSADGAARFDGQTFVRFGTEAGLPSPAIQDLLQTRDGCYWFATDKGLCRLNPALPPGGRGPGQDSDSPTSRRRRSPPAPGRQRRNPLVRHHQWPPAHRPPPRGGLPAAGGAGAAPEALRRPHRL